MRRTYLNLGAGAWARLAREWSPPLTPLLADQRWIAGPVFSALAKLQTMAHRHRRDAQPLNGAVVILGYWRSGTTLLHELLCRDPARTFPTTQACMSPHSALLTRGQADAVVVPRPMDGMPVGPASPQEDEFALLGLGARSPYEALLFPSHLAQALALGDPTDLSAADQQRWERIFVDFIRMVTLAGDGKPVILKSPPHSYRVATLRRLLPDARFIVITRDPYEVLESATRMWREMFELYALETPPRDDDIRAAILTDRPRLEAKLRAGCAGLPPDRLAEIRYEDLVADPVNVIADLYRQLELGDFTPIRPLIAHDMANRQDFRPRKTQPSREWRAKINIEWDEIFSYYRYAKMI